MTRLDVALLVVLLASALYLVRTSYEARDLYTQLDKQNALEHELHAEYEQLDVERRGQATPLRVERLARERLRMANASPAVTQYVAASLPSPLPLAAPVETASQPVAAASTQP